MREFGRFLVKLSLIGLLVIFGIFYGIDLATHGISEINGPLVTTSAGTDSADQLVQAEKSEKRENDERGEFNEASAQSGDPFARLRSPSDPALVNVLADATGHVLQRTARGGIEFFVSLFNGILH